jgi:hypothetical protein
MFGRYHGPLNADVRWLMRAALERETPLIVHLLAQAKLTVDISQLHASPMDDGGMGSLLFATAGTGPRHAKEVAVCYFEDEDGVSIRAGLNVDQHEQLYELDVWKVDFSPLRRWPAASDIRDTPKCSHLTMRWSGS